MNQKRIILVMVLGVLFLSACSNTQEVLPEEISLQNTQETKIDLGATETLQDEKVTVLNARSWEFDQALIRVKKGEKLTIKVNNVDTLHGIAIPEMQLVGDEEVVVDTSKIGEYNFQCLNYCGEGHQNMIGKLIIE